MNKKLFEEIIEDWDDDDVMTYDGDEMEDWSWDDFDDEGDYDPFTYTQMGDGSGGIGARTKTAAYASNLKGGDYAPTFDDGTVLGGNFDNDDNSDFAMSDDADLDAWAREA